MWTDWHKQIQTNSLMVKQPTHNRPSLGSIPSWSTKHNEENHRSQSRREHQGMCMDVEKGRR